MTLAEFAEVIGTFTAILAFFLAIHIVINRRFRKQMQREHEEYMLQRNRERDQTAKGS